MMSCRFEQTKHLVFLVNRSLPALHRVLHQHRDRHRTHASRNRRNQSALLIALPFIHSTTPTSLKSTSPQRWYPLLSVGSSTAFIPTSMITQPSLIMSAFTRFATPTAATMISAFCRCSFRSAVREWQIVTVALRFSSNMATGMPTMLLRPITTAFFPAISTPYRSSSSMHPLGVHGTNNGSRPFMDSLPMLRGWKPSTSFSMEMAFRIRSSLMCLGRGS